MLVIARREKEAVIAGDIEIEVLSIRGNQVRLGIKAPDNVVVSRKELVNPEGGRKKARRPTLSQGNR
jgi:carbon storage regulator